MYKQRGFSNGERKTPSTQRVDVYTDLRPGHIEPLTFREKLLHDREQEIGLASEQRETKSSARLPQKKRLSLGIMGRVAAFNQGDFEEEHKPKQQPAKQAPKLDPEYTELTIKMKQRPRNENGFGFTIVGGADSGRSIIVTSITPGSTAEKCGLEVSDEIVAIDGEKTKLVTYDHAMYCFNSSTLCGELSLKIHRYEDLAMRIQPSESTRHTHSKSDKFPMRRAFSQPSDANALKQAARARKILEQMREEEQRLEEQRRDREEEKMAPTVNGKQNWNHSNMKPEPLRSSYNEPEPQEEHLGDTISSGLTSASLSDPQHTAICRHQGKTDQSKLPVHETEIKLEAKEKNATDTIYLFSMLERNSPDEKQYGKPVQAGIELLSDEMSPKQDTMSPDARVVLDESKEDVDEKYPNQGTQVEVGGEIIDAEEMISKSEVAQEQSVNIWKVFGHDSLEMPQSNPLAKEAAGPDGGMIEGSPDSKPEEVESEGEIFSSEEDEIIDEDIMNRMEEEQLADDEEEARNRCIQDDELNKLAIQEDFITPQSKQTEESPVSFNYLTMNEIAPLQASSQPSEYLPPSKLHTTVDSSKPPKYHPVKFSAGPKPFTNRLGPEPYKPPGFKSVNMEDTKPDVKQDMLKRRSDFFNDDKEKNDTSGTSSLVIGASVTTEGQMKKPVDSSAVLKPEPKQPVSLSTRKAFNVEEEKKRLERWHAEQERIRQEQYEQEQRRLKEQQEKDLEKAETEERRRKIEEHQRLLEKQKVFQEQAVEERKRLEQERKERVRQEQEFLEQARLEREEAEKERLKDEEEQQKMAAERMKREEEYLRKKEEKRQRKEGERKAQEEANRQREKEEWHQQELERQDQEAEARRIEINILREKEAEERARRKKEEEARMALAHKEKEKEWFAHLREEEIERIRLEEREKLRKEWEDLQRERAKQEERERLELERLEQLRAEQERLRQERIKMEQQQEEEKRQLKREKERLMARPKLTTDKIPYNQLDKDRNSEDPEVIENDNHCGELDDQGQEKKILISEEKSDVYSAPPPKSKDKDKDGDSYNVPGQSYLSQYKDGSMATQHWVIEEAERRRLAEKSGTTHLNAPVEVHTGPILRKDLDMEPVLEKKSHDLEYAAPISHINKPVMKEPTKSRDQDNWQQHAPPQQVLNQGYREVAVDVPANFQAAPRRLRASENEAERKKKIQNRQSMPDMGNRVPDVVRNESHTPPPRGSDRNSAHMPDNFLQQPQLGPPSRNSAFQQPSKKPAPGRSVSGKVMCSNCAKSLGRGAAMIIESLGLHFHIECFRCCVCNIQLGNGTQGTDVRIRASKLHCQNCYSNDAGFEFTEV